MRFVLVGAPDTGKAKIIREVSERSTHRVSYSDSMYSSQADYAVGYLADYRMELALAVERVFQAADDLGINSHVIYSHSLLDNVAYSAIRLISLRDGGASEYTLEKWRALVTIIAVMCRESFKSDHIFFLHSDDEEQATLENALLTVLDSFNLDFTTLDGTEEENIETVNDIIRRCLEESREEDSSSREGESRTVDVDAKEQSRDRHLAQGI
jgi:hypothetical protein